MTPAQTNYIRRCYADYKATLSWCERCDPDPKPVYNRWADAVHSVVVYANDLIAEREGFPQLLESERPVYDIVSFNRDPINTWGGGVFKGDDYDSPCGWYWQINKADPVQWADTPADAFIAFITELEVRLKADPSAKSLRFVVRLSKHTCEGDDHDWEFLYTGRHGSDKGDDVYQCRVCGTGKTE